MPETVQSEQEKAEEKKKNIILSFLLPLSENPQFSENQRVKEAAPFGAVFLSLIKVWGYLG